MRIAHFMHCIWEAGGIASYIARVSEMQRADGHEIFYFDLESARSAEHAADEHVIYVKDDADLLERVRQRSIDLLHAHTLVRGLERVSVPCVRMVHGHQPYCPSGSRYLSRSSKPCNRSYTLLGCTWGHLVDHCGSIRPRNFVDDFRRTEAEMRGLRHVWVVTPSEFVRQQLIRAGYEASRIESVSLPVPERPAPSPPPQTSPPRFTFIGRLVESKGVLSLIRSMAYVKSNARVDLAGSGPAEGECRALIDRLNLKDRVTLHGWLDQNSVIQLLQNSRALLFPSVWHEPGGTAAFEAMMAGRAVICSRVGGMPEVVLDEQCGILYQPADEKTLASAIDRLAGNWDLAARFGAFARAHVVANYTLRRHVDHLMSIYDKCIMDFASRSKAGRDPLPEGAPDAAGL